MSYLNKLFESLDHIRITPIDEDGEGIEYNTPYSFKEEDDEDEPFKESMTLVEEALKKLDEISYNDYKRDDTKTQKEKINQNIIEINKCLSHSEKLINHALKLKTEIGADPTFFYKDTLRKFTKIGERLNRLQIRIKEFSK